MRLVGRLLLRWEALLVVLIFAAGVWSTTLSPFFLHRANLLDLTTPYAYLGIMAFGLTFVVVAGEIDISVASTMTVSAVSFAQLWHAGVNVWLASLVGLLIAAGLGLVNGVLIAILNLPSLAVTLGTLAAYRGLAYVILGGNARSGFPTSFTNIGGGYIHNELPYALLVLIGTAIVLGVVLHSTRFGRYLYTIGANREASRFSGVPDTRVRVSIFVLSGLTAGVAGIVYLGYFGSVQADAASGSELITVVTAVVLGGVDIFGGAAQDLVVGGLLLGAILAGNVVRAAQERGLPWWRARRPQKEVEKTESHAQISVNPGSETTQGGFTR